jgi:glutamine cyclotransferase
MIALALLSCKPSEKARNYSQTITEAQILSQHQIPVYGYRIVQTYPHDTAIFTEGLFLEGADLYESTGHYSHSAWLHTNLSSGKMLSKHVLPSHYFAEGIAILGNHLYQLTYQSHHGFVYNKQTQTIEKTFTYSGEGWGLTTDGQSLIMSNGTATLSFLDPTTFAIKRQIVVHTDDTNMGFINSLAYVKGVIYANIWLTDIIAMISPETGRIMGWIDFTGLRPAETRQNNDSVLNGIAYDESDQTFLVTGKNWPYMYKVKFVSKLKI